MNRNRWLVLVLLSCLLVSLLVWATHAFVTIVDDAGANDEPGQKDLTKLSVDDTHPGLLYVNWNWDETTGFSGVNTGDACALIDTDGDGLVNYAMCVTIQDLAGIPTQVVGSPRLYSCDETPAAVADERCTSSALLPGPYASNCTVVSPSSDDPFAAGDDFPSDTKAVCTFAFSDIGTSGVLLNVCSYPSQVPNSAPSDCVVTPGSGFLTIVKVASPDDGTPFDFTLDPAANDGQTLFTILGSGSMQMIPVAAGTYSLTETVPPGWDLTIASCTVQGSETGGFSDDSVTEFEVRSGAETVCTFHDEIPLVAQPLIDLTKSGTLDPGPNGIPDVGDLIHYVLTVQNVGNVDLFDVAVIDLLVGPVSCPQTTLATDPDGQAPLEGETMTCTASYPLTQPDIDAGQVDNTATATGHDEAGTQVSDPASASVPLARRPQLDIEKFTNGQDADSPPGPSIPVGGAVTWTYTVTNTGNVTLSGIGVTDDLLGPICTIPSLAPGASQTCSRAGAAVAGQYANVGTASASFSGTPVSDSDPSHYFGAAVADPCVNVLYLDYAFADSNLNTRADRISGSFQLNDATPGGPVPAVNVNQIALMLHYKYGTSWKPIAANCTMTPTAPFTFSGNKLVTFSCLGLVPEIQRYTTASVTVVVTIPNATGTLTRQYAKAYY